MAQHPPWSDGEALRALDMQEREGMNYVQIGKALGRSRENVSDLFRRIRDDMARFDKDGNHNGTMPADWWKAGLERRQETEVWQ